MIDALDRMDDDLVSAGGVYPRRSIELSIERAACIGCRVCATLAPDLVRMDDEGKAVVTTPLTEWSRADGDFVHQCPTKAIKVTALEGSVRRDTMEWLSAPEGEDDTVARD